MRPLAVLSAFLIMLRVSGLAPDLHWGWALFPLMLPFLVVGAGIVMVLAGAVVAMIKGK
ncbi:MAG: hypothetical protein WBA83_16900 [Burkholderiaceae bacterium]